MKRSLLIVLAMFFAATLFVAQAQAKLPTSSDELEEQISKQAKTPEGVVHLFMDGIFLYSESETRALGRQALKAVLFNLPSDWESNQAYQRFIKRIKKETHIFRSYCKGTSAANNYKVDLNKCELTIVKVKKDGDKYRVVSLKSTGADSARSITLQQDDKGQWKVSTFSSIYLGVKK